MSNKEAIFTNERYEVVIGKSTVTVDDDVDVYLVMNRETRVIETESSVLPQAITWANDFNATMDDLLGPELAKIDRPAFQH